MNFSKVSQLLMKIMNYSCVVLWIVITIAMIAGLYFVSEMEQFKEVITMGYIMSMMSVMLIMVFLSLYPIYLFIRFINGKVTDNITGIIRWNMGVGLSLFVVFLAGGSINPDHTVLTSTLTALLLSITQIANAIYLIKLRKIH